MTLTASRPNQLLILPAIAATVRSHFEIAPVPQRIALDCDLVYIWLVKGFERWNIPIQLTELEARSLLPLLEQEGETNRGYALWIVELAIKGVES